MLNSTSQKTVPHLIIAIVAAAVIVYVGRMTAERLVGTPPPAEPVKQVAKPAATNSVEEEDRLAAEAKRERVIREQALIVEAKERRRLKELEIEAIQAQTAAAARSEEERKNLAWQRFYKKPKKCDNPPDNAAIVDCSNHYIREQQRFERNYAADKEP